MNKKQKKTKKKKGIYLRKTSRTKSIQHNIDKTKSLYNKFNNIIKNKKEIELSKHILIKLIILETTHVFLKNINLNYKKYSIKNLLDKLKEINTKGIPYNHYGALILKKKYKLENFYDKHTITGYSTF